MISLVQRTKLPADAARAWEFFRAMEDHYHAPSPQAIRRRPLSAALDLDLRFGSGFAVMGGAWLEQATSCL